VQKLRIAGLEEVTTIRKREALCLDLSQEVIRVNLAKVNKVPCASLK